MGVWGQGACMVIVAINDTSPCGQGSHDHHSADLISYKSPIIVIKGGGTQCVWVHHSYCMYSET